MSALPKDISFSSPRHKAVTAQPSSRLFSESPYCSLARSASTLEPTKEGISCVQPLLPRHSKAVPVSTLLGSPGLDIRKSPS